MYPVPKAPEVFVDLTSSSMSFVHNQAALLQYIRFNENRQVFVTLRLYSLLHSVVKRPSSKRALWILRN